MTEARFRAGVVGLSLALAAGAASAADITYAVNRTVGSGSVVGTVTTDGAVGVLGASDIVDFNLMLSGPGATFDLTSPASVSVNGADLTATAHDLSFNFSGADNGYFLLQQVPFSGKNYYCDATSSTVCLPGESGVPGSYNDASAQIVAQSGEQVIGVAGVPEPASWAVMLVGVSLLGAALRRRPATA